MTTFTAPTGTVIEDEHGVQHTDPVFIIQSARKGETTDTRVGYAVDQQGEVTNTESTNTTKRLTYHVHFWTNQTAFDEHKKPIEFVKPVTGNEDPAMHPGGGQTQFIVDLGADNPSTYATIRTACENDFLANIMPSREVTS